MARSAGGKTCTPCSRLGFWSETSATVMAAAVGVKAAISATKSSAIENFIFTFFLLLTLKQKALLD